MKSIFFSDVHLDVAYHGGADTNEFISFLHQIDPAEVDQVLILGDVFDFWFEYKHVVFSGYFDVLRAFADLNDAGVAFHLVCGNHDFWAGRFLRHHLGFTVHQEPLVMQLGDHRVLMAHGDGLNAKDWRYRIYRRIARAAPVIWLFRLLHPDWAMALARRISGVSRARFKAVD